MTYTQEEIIKANGPFTAPEQITEEYLGTCIEEIAKFPKALTSFMMSLQAEHQFHCYRPEGWSYRQTVHHIADSHMQAFTRFKLALTEDMPTVKPYSQNAWANTSDSLEVDALISCALIIPLHERWLHLLKTMEFSDFDKKYFHPEYAREYSLGEVLGLYAWHGKHHLTQLQRHAHNQGWITLA
jgi:hypothetical protein